MSRFTLEQPLFLVGFMGVGKSSLGGRLARDFSVEFVDLDKRIEESAGCSVVDFFEKYGQEEFRRQERRVLEQLLVPRGMVVATGGGTACYFDNMQQMRRHGYTVHLQLPQDILIHRLQHLRPSRPLLRGLRGEELINHAMRLLEERTPYYAQAHITADARTLSSEMLQNLLELMPSDRT